MKKVWIDPGCISCGACEFIAPEIFEIHHNAQVKKNINIKLYEKKIKEAAKNCPVQVIKYSEKNEKP
ncbi:ferredoxin [Candidatus Dependentiae bacterium]|nr:ferredoxin [Candidatus Dependentiae bacterium]